MRDRVLAGHMGYYGALGKQILNAKRLMPLTKKGKKILSSMKKTYKTTKKAKSVMYAMKNAGKMKGIDKKKK